MKWLNLRHKGMFDFRVEFYRFYLLHDKRDIRQKDDTWCVKNMLDRTPNLFVTFWGNAKK